MIRPGLLRAESGIRPILLVLGIESQGLNSLYCLFALSEVLQRLDLEAELVVDLPEKIRVESWLVPRQLTRS